VNIGLAVSVEGGLLVPNVKSVQDKGLLQIARETEELVSRAREGTLPLDAVQGGTFTITNLGMFGTSSFTPVINPPEACILGLNAVADRPVAIGGQVVVRPMTTLSLSADHRILDGAEAARFLARIRELVENPWLLLLN
jgi:pyruvate dehydrogenase E2 component (dihydrolipoamide acetyltransferase)